MRIGIFGGSFNPIHNGHIHLALSVQEQLNLDKIIFVPSKIPPHKKFTEYAPDNDRIAMCRLAVKINDNFEVDDFEMLRGGISYSIYTVEHFRSIYCNDELFMLIGSDMLLSFDKWYRYKDILKYCNIVAASREKDDMDKLQNKVSGLREYGEIRILNVPPMPMSSTQIRKKIRAHEDFSCYLNENVVQYIRFSNLYL